MSAAAATRKPANPWRRVLAAALAVALGWAVAMPAVAQESDPVADEPASEADYARLVDNAVALHVRPAYERFAASAELLDLAFDGTCAAPTEVRLADVRRAFEGSVRALSALDPVRFGPILDGNRLERLAFWPDARGLGLRQVQKLIADEDPLALDPGGLAGKSVAVQGLTALEFVLYGTGAETMAEPESYRCRYGAAIARSVRGIADELVVAWEEGGSASRRFTEPGPDNPQFASHKEAAGEVVNAMATAMEIVSDQKLRAILGDTAAKAKPKQAPFWRSHQTMTGIVSTLEATQHLFEVSGVVDLLEPVEAWLGNSILFELGNSMKTARSITAPIDVMVSDPASRDAARYLATATASLKRSIGRELTAMIGLEQGFNALDGD